MEALGLSAAEFDWDAGTFLRSLEILFDARLLHIKLAERNISKKRIKIMLLCSEAAQRGGGGGGGGDSLLQITKSAPSRKDKEEINHTVLSQLNPLCCSHMHMFPFCQHIPRAFSQHQATLILLLHLFIQSGRLYPCHSVHVSLCVRKIFSLLIFNVLFSPPSAYCVTNVILDFTTVTQV